ncbi:MULTISPECIES: hypothetical protein [Ruegeria]|uniref:hypothetical protein n=1 Tax=Ruegeria TaxID=97050 RepID=UPI00148065DD|nr:MULTISPECIES: hypothetical protein [Ruegeria]UWR05929.1 hypothetical protein K3752_09640 [Ruegeria sp. B32]
MNANRIIDMIVRQVMRRLVTRGVDKGFDLADRATRKSGQQSQPRGPQTDRRMAQSAGGQSPSMKQAKQLTRQMRRFMRF